VQRSILTIPKNPAKTLKTFRLQSVDFISSKIYTILGNCNNIMAVIAYWIRFDNDSDSILD